MMVMIRNIVIPIVGLIIVLIVLLVIENSAVYNWPWYTGIIFSMW